MDYEANSCFVWLHSGNAVDLAVHDYDNLCELNKLSTENAEHLNVVAVSMLWLTPLLAASRIPGKCSVSKNTNCV